MMEQIVMALHHTTASEDEGTGSPSFSPLPTHRVNLRESVYSVVRLACEALSWRTALRPDPATISWLDGGRESYTQMRVRIINHFYGMNFIGTKCNLASALNRAKNILPREYNFHPLSFNLPVDLPLLLEYGKRFEARLGRQWNKHLEESQQPECVTLDEERRGCCEPTRAKQPQPIPSVDGTLHLILKPDCSSRGIGIRLVSMSELTTELWGPGTPNAPLGRTLAQTYLPRPMLIDGRKFDLRIYVLVTSVLPTFRVFVSRAGLARFATAEYAAPANDNMGDVRMFLTNFAVNQSHTAAEAGNPSSCKWSLDSLFAVLAAEGIDVVTLWARIKDVIAKTLIVARPTLASQYKAMRQSIRSHSGSPALSSRSLLRTQSPARMGSSSKLSHSVPPAHTRMTTCSSTRIAPKTSAVQSSSSSQRGLLRAPPSLTICSGSSSLSTPVPKTPRSLVEQQQTTIEQGFQCFELLGVDILLDMGHCRCADWRQQQNLSSGAVSASGSPSRRRCQPRPVLLEVNQTPAMALDSDLDRRVKIPVTACALQLASASAAWLEGQLRGTGAHTHTYTNSSMSYVYSEGEDCGSTVPSRGVVDADTRARKVSSERDGAALARAHRKGALDSVTAIAALCPEAWALESWLPDFNDSCTPAQLAVLLMRRAFEDAKAGVFDRVLPPNSAEDAARYRANCEALPPSLFG